MRKRNAALSVDDQKSILDATFVVAHAELLALGY
jgi:hypothetical protein